jgi:SAM-dependent methyltransferase
MLTDRFRTIHDAVLLDHPELRPLSSFSRFKTTVELVAKHARPGSHVVDVGAWPGLLTACLARSGFGVSAVDKAPQRPVTWHADVLLEAEGLSGHDSDLRFDELCAREGVQVLRTDIEREALPLPPGSVDVVLLTEVIEHLWTDPIFALREMNRILKEETGLLIVSTPNLTSIRNRLNFICGRIDQVIEHPFVSFLKAQRVGHLGHCRLYAPDELETMLLLLGFRSTFVFTRMGPATDPTPPEGQADMASPSAEPRPRSPSRLIRSPRNYGRAAVATSLAAAERAIPRWRPQIFVIAQKERNADFERNYPREARELVNRNRLSSGRCRV